MGNDRDDEVIRVAELFGGVARALADHADVHTTLDRIVHLAVENLDACEHASISRVQGRRIETRASTGGAARAIEAIQTELQEGPCLDAIRDRELFRTGDLLGEQRWPAFSTRAHEETGVRSIVGIRLFVAGDTIGALNLYSTHADAFDDTDVALATVFAAHASVAMGAAEREEHLEHKAATRDLIGQAKGILMAHSHIDDGAAFDLLKRASQRANIKLTAVAQDVIDRQVESRPPPHDAQTDPE